MQYKITSPIEVESVVQYLRSLPLDGKTYSVEITFPKKKRTVSQNRLYRLWLSCIARETGNDPDTLHDFFARKFLGTRIETVGSQQTEMPVSTTTLSTEGFTIYLNSISAFAQTELGITLPNPDDLIWNQFENYYGN